MADTRWVCLMYHDITEQAPATGGGPARFAVAREEFRRQLDQLRSEGYGAGSLREVLHQPDRRTLAITFDDGSAGQYEHGYRALAERTMSATFFVTTDRIGTSGYVSWEQLREMRAAGMDIQSHAKSHRFLSELSAPELADELRGSKAALDEALGQNTDMLALPGGDWPRPVMRHLIAEAGYRIVATSRWGVNGVPGTQGGALTVVRRCTVSGAAGAERFARMAAGDPWLARRRRVREGVLAALRSALGPSRYASWRRAFLDAVAP